MGRVEPREAAAYRVYALNHRGEILTGKWVDSYEEAAERARRWFHESTGIDETGIECLMADTYPVQITGFIVDERPDHVRS